MDKTEAYQETLATLRRELSEIEERRKQLTEAIRVIQQLVPSQKALELGGLGSWEPTPLTPPRRRDLSTMTMIQAAEVVLREAGRPMHIKDLVSAILGRGFVYKGKDADAMRASLTGSMERKGIFDRTAPATYGLSVWSSNGKGNDEAGAAE